MDELHDLGSTNVSDENIQLEKDEVVGLLGGSPKLKLIK